MMNNTFSQEQGTASIYTHNLPYGVRRDICNLLDADQSWKQLAGQFIGLDSTQLALIGQAYMRNGSPTDELLSRLDSTNMQISEFCFYLQQMNHYRALEILRPYLCELNDATRQITNNQGEMLAKSLNYNPINQKQIGQQTLDTPTPSFAESLGAFLEIEPPPTIGLTDELAAASPWLEPSLNKPTDCHKRDIIAPEKKNQDPGEEIVRLACASNRKRTSISDQEVVNQLRLIMQITYKELKQASNDFSQDNILGNGGFASVYRGRWKGTDVAIKRLKCNLMDQALNELTILNSYRIDNILPIYGISIDGPEACLVYQFMANGSLEDRLGCRQGSPALSWQQRAQIGEGVAKGLFYLHTLRDKPLVHGDVKSANVLLDAQFVPKLGDFGLARQVFKGRNPSAGSEQCTHCTVSSIHGTSVYLPPEYLRHKILSPAVDVYSYGTVLLEMATGRRAYDGKRLLVDLVEDETLELSKGRISYSLKDARLSDNQDQLGLSIWFELLIKLGLECVHKVKKKRPDMGQVLARFSEFWAPLGLDGGQTPEQQTQGETRPATNNYSALMSVEEEECEQQVGANNLDEAATRVDPKNQEQQVAAVEAMIPLITELGISAEK